MHVMRVCVLLPSLQHLTGQVAALQTLMGKGVGDARIEVRASAAKVSAGCPCGVYVCVCVCCAV